MRGYHGLDRRGLGGRKGYCYGRGRKVLIGFQNRESIFFLPLRLLLQRGCVEAVEAIEAGLSNDIDLLNGSFPSWETLDRSRQLPLLLLLLQLVPDF